MQQSARRLFELGYEQATGAFAIRANAGTAVVELLRGWVHAVDLAPVGLAQPVRGEDALRLLLPVAVGPGNFSADAPPRKRGACTPFHPAAPVRNFLDGLKLDAALWRARAGVGTVVIVHAPHPSCVGQDERPLVAFLGRPRSVDEIEKSGLCPVVRADRLLTFLHAVGALAFAASPASPYKLLQLPDGAPLDEVKRAYRRLARELHPDRHPSASPEDQRELERRFAEVSAAYRRLV